MKKGKSILLITGILDIFFALGLFSLIGLHFIQIDYIYGLFVPFLSTIFLFLPITIELFEILGYVLLGVLGIIGLFSLIFGSVSIARVKKEPKKYYRKGGRLIAFVILETIFLALFVWLLIRYYSLVSVIIISALGLIVLFRYIGIGMFYNGKKKFVKETPVA